MRAYLISGVALALLAVAAHAQDITPGGIGGPGAPVGPGPAGAPPNGSPKAPRSGAAHFILFNGEAMVDVKCADEDSMKTCADITLQMLDKLVVLRGSDVDHSR